MYVSSAVRLTAAAFVAALIAGGCNCDRGQVSRSYGEIGISHVDETGSVVTGREAVYDFGTIPMGEQVTKKLVVKNLGTGLLTLVSMERLEGDPVTIGTVVEEKAAFDVKFVPETAIGSSESAEFDMVFAPPLFESSDPTQAHYVKLVLSAGGTREGADTATIILRGTAAAGACDLPDVIDFGKVANGNTAQQVVTFRNTAVIESQAFVGDITSTTGDHQAFGIAASSPKGTFTIAAGGEQPVTFEFKPTETRAYAASIRLKAGGSCGEKDVQLIGSGTEDVLEWNPTSLDFNYVSPGQESIRQVTFINHTSSPVELFNIGSTMPGDFAMKAEQGTDPSKFLVPANGEAKMNVMCKPTSLGQRNATLNFQTPITKQPQGSIALACFGGGPEIQVSPAGTLNFGKTAFFSNANPPYSVTRRITVMNVGSTPPNGNPDGNLRLGKLSSTGVPGQLPFIALKALNATTAIDEITIGIPPSYKPDVGLEAAIGKNVVDLTVTFTPKSLGQKQAELTIYSNDPDEPETKILITSDAVAMPPCNYTVTPAQVNFGLVTPGTFKEVPVTFTNLGTDPNDVCLISGVDLAPGTDPSYKMPDGAIASKELQPGESFQALVRVEPQGTVPNAVVNLTGNLVYYASSPSKPSGNVPLTTAVGPSCLTIAPAHQDFGAAKPGCATATRTFTIYNVCSQNITLSSIQMQVAAGQAAGGPNCAGTQACPEFFLTSTPSIPSGGLTIPAGGSPVTFQARYKPIDLGPDSGVIAVNVIQSGASVAYLVTLAGKGDAAGQQTDVFTQDAQPKADVLFTIDNSCSMGGFQTSLSNNFASFMQYATSANVDWHLGVTTTDMEDGMASPFPGIPAIPPGDKGKLRGDATNPKILTPTTPNVASLFQQKVNVGTDGSGIETGLEPSLKAVTPPLSVAENAGFLRQDANLAIIVVTDAPDQSNQSSTFYVNSLLNVKGFNKANMFTFNAIAGFNPTPPSGCVYDGNADDGTYADVVAQTNGIKEEICTQSWATALQGLGKTAFGFRTTFFLTSVPDLTQPMSVTIDGIAVPQTTGGTPNWTLDQAINAIVFNQNTAPGPGQTLSITYYVGCLP